MAMVKCGECGELIHTCAGIKCSSSRPWSWASCKAPSRQSGSPLPCECFSLRVNINNTLKSNRTTEQRNAEARSFLWHPPQSHCSLVRSELSETSVDIRTFMDICDLTFKPSKHSRISIINYSDIFRLFKAAPPVSSVARVAPQSVSQRFEAPNALVDIPQHSLAHRRPDNMKMAWESRGHFWIGKSWSVGKESCWNIMNILWTS